MNEDDEDADYMEKETKSHHSGRARLLQPNSALHVLRRLPFGEVEKSKDELLIAFDFVFSHFHNAFPHIQVHKCLVRMARRRLHYLFST